jgi:hypothetical protein
MFPYIDFRELNTKIVMKILDRLYTVFKKHEQTYVIRDLHTVTMTQCMLTG